MPVRFATPRRFALRLAGLPRLASFVVAALCLLPAGCDRGQHPSQIGEQAPAFALGQGNQGLTLNQLRGHVVVLNFWATWCAPCIQELPDLDALQRDVPQVKLLGIATDDSPEVYQSFLTRHPVGFATALDPGGQNISNALYGTFRYPETYVIDKNGVVRRKFIGPQPWTDPEIEDYLRKLAA